MKRSYFSYEMKIKETVDKLIKKHKTRDPQKLIEALGINIYERDLESMQGFYIKVGRVKNIIINSSNSEDFKRFVLAHELGHALLHPNENIQCLRKNIYCKTNVYEVEANTFAAYLLIDDEIFNELKEYKGYSLQEIAAIKRVPNEILLLRLPKETLK